MINATNNSICSVKPEKRLTGGRSIFVCKRNAKETTRLLNLVVLFSFVNMSKLMHLQLYINVFNVMKMMGNRTREDEMSNTQL